MTRQEHHIRRSILMKLTPRMPTAYGHDLKADYNRQLRARRAKRRLAWACCAACAALLFEAFWQLCDRLDSQLFASVGISIILSGIWGLYHLSTHH